MPETYRAARRILDRVRPTLQTSRLLRRPYSPTSFNSESLLHVLVSFGHNRLKQRRAHVQWPVVTDNRADSKGLRGTREVFEWARGGILIKLLTPAMDTLLVLQTYLTCSCGDGWRWKRLQYAEAGNLFDCGEVNFAQYSFPPRDSQTSNPK